MATALRCSLDSPLTPHPSSLTPHTSPLPTHPPGTHRRGQVDYKTSDRLIAQLEALGLLKRGSYKIAGGGYSKLQVRASGGREGAAWLAPPPQRCTVGIGQWLRVGGFPFCSFYRRIPSHGHHHTHRDW